MPRIIAQNRIPRVTIASRGINAQPSDSAGPGYMTNFPAGFSGNWFPPRAGFWDLVLWGGGKLTFASAVNGDSGGFCKATVFLTTASKVVVLIGGTQGQAQMTLPSGRVLLATAGSGDSDGPNPGIGSGGDVNLSGNFGGAEGLAPSYGPYRGGNVNASPGGGGGGGNGQPGDPMAFAVFLKG
jgi:hypothetical protein